MDLTGLLSLQKLFNLMRPLHSFDLIAMQQIVPGDHSDHFPDAFRAALIVK